jgi:hypothetical protein
MHVYNLRWLAKLTFPPATYDSRELRQAGIEPGTIHHGSYLEISSKLKREKNLFPTNLIYIAHKSPETEVCPVGLILCKYCKDDPNIYKPALCSLYDFIFTNIRGSR